MDNAVLWDEFRQEADEHLRALDAELIKLERDPASQDAVRRMFLSAHTIKGGAAMVGVLLMRDLAHAIEDVLGVLRDGHQQLNGDVADLLFSAVDVLKLQLASEGRSDDEVAVARLIQTLGELAVSLSQPSPRPAPPVVVPRTIGTGPRALLVEDSPTVRMLEEMLLTDAGFEVDSVGDGLEALTRALAGVYDLVVSGIEIPGMGGLDLARALRAAPSAQHLPIIIMTSSERAADRQRAAELGVDELIRKGSLGRQRLVEAAQSVAQRRTM